MEPYPPEYDEEPPEDGIVEHEIAIGVCRDCEEILGPTYSVDVGLDIASNHIDHETEIIRKWTEVEVLEYIYFND